MGRSVLRRPAAGSPPPNPNPNRPQALNPNLGPNLSREPRPDQVVYDVGGSSSGADSGYSDLVPHLASIDDFLSASRSAVQQNKMLVVKFYSKRCRACLRIAAKYRRIARRYGEQVACYEMEQHAAGRELLELLAVDQVPTTPAQRARAGPGRIVVSEAPLFLVISVKQSSTENARMDPKATDNRRSRAL